MKTALLVQNLEGFPSRSSVRYADALSAALKTREASAWRVEMPLVAAPDGVLERLGNANASRYGRLVVMPRRLRGWQREFRPDVVHVLDHSHANLLKACDPARSVVTVHDVIPMLSAIGELDFKRGWLVKKTFERKLMLVERCGAVVVPSAATKRQLLRFVDLPGERVHVVHHGVHQGPEAFHPDVPPGEREAVRSRYGIRDGQRVMLHVCTRNRYKNTPAVLRALARLQGNVVLLRVGGDLFDDEQELAASLGVSGRVIEAGRIVGDEGLAAVYRSADVFVFPSTFEGFGWPVIEAMACGLPVATSTAGSLPEVAGEAAVLVDPYDDAALTEAVRHLLDDPAMHARQREAGLTRVATFTWDVAAAKVLNVYQELHDSMASGVHNRIDQPSV